jgi:hypothetical protein
MMNTGLIPLKKGTTLYVLIKGGGQKARLLLKRRGAALPRIATDINY